MLKAKRLTQDTNLKENDTLVFPIMKSEDYNQIIQNTWYSKIMEIQVTIFLPFPSTFFTNTAYYYMLDTNLVMKNAKLTAFGFLCYLEELHFDFEKDSVDIIGYGKCGEAIYTLLKALQIQNRVVRRKSENSKFIQANEYNEIVKSRYIINTAIENIIDLQKINGEYTSYIIDISSDKVIDPTLLDNTIKLCYPGSLPEKFFPYNSALLIKDFIKGIENEK